MKVSVGFSGEHKCTRSVGTTHVRTMCFYSSLLLIIVLKAWRYEKREGTEKSRKTMWPPMSFSVSAASPLKETPEVRGTQTITVRLVLRFHSYTRSSHLIYKLKLSTVSIVTYVLLVARVVSWQNMYVNVKSYVLEIWKLTGGQFCYQKAIIKN